MREPLTPAMLRHAADLMEGRAAGMKIMAAPFEGAVEGGLPIGPTLRSLACYLLSKLRNGWKLRLVERENSAPKAAFSTALVAPLAPAEEAALLRHVADIVVGAAAGDAVVARHAVLGESGTVPYPATTSHLLDCARHGWALRLKKRAEAPTPTEESALFRKVAELVDGAAKGLPVCGTPPDGTIASDPRILVSSAHLLSLLRYGWHLWLDKPAAKKVPLTREAMSLLAGRVLVWSDRTQLCIGTADMYGGYCVQFAERAWMESRGTPCKPRNAQELLNEGVHWRAVADDPKTGKLHPCWAVEP